MSEEVFVYQHSIEVAHKINPTASVYQHIVEVAIHYWGSQYTMQRVVEIAYQPGADIYGPSVQHI